MKLEGAGEPVVATENARAPGLSDESLLDASPALRHALAAALETSVGTAAFDPELGRPVRGAFHYHYCAPLPLRLTARCASRRLDRPQFMSSKPVLDPCRREPGARSDLADRQTFGD